MTDINFAAIKVNRDNQFVFIAADIEDDPMVNFVYRRKNCTQFSKILKVGFLNDLEPTRQCCSAVRVFFPELYERFAGYDMHAEIVSQIEIRNKAEFSSASLIANAVLLKFLCQLLPPLVPLSRHERSVKSQPVGDSIIARFQAGR